MEFYKLFHWRRDWPELLSMEKVLMSDELRTRCEEKMSRMARQIFDVMLLSKLEFREVNVMNKMQIGDSVEIKAQVVDYNDSLEKVKLRILGYTEDKATLTEKYIWLNCTDVKRLN